MKYEVYSVYDRVLGLYQDPFLSINVGSAVRRFKAQCANNFTAPDLCLYRIGTFDSGVGAILPSTNPELIITGGVDVNE